MNFIHEEWSEVYRDVPQEVEVILDRGKQELHKFLLERAQVYDVIYITRPHNLAAFNACPAQARRRCERVKIIYDAESLSWLREIGRLRLKGKRVSTEEEKRLMTTEVQSMRNCDAITAVSERERQELLAHGYERVHLLGHALVCAPTPKSFLERKDILFVGSIHDAKSPNADSLVWFVKKILPRVLERVGPDVNLLVAGHGTSQYLGDYDSRRIKVLGGVGDLTGLYNDARIFIAPTRYAAGIPHKAHEAAGHGLPLVATKLIGSQLGWQDEEELLIADDPASFAAACVRLYKEQPLWERLRQNALKRVESDCAPTEFAECLRGIMD
jgi:glycosyltransferase involved in cell wall biosynthesis